MRIKTIQIGKLIADELERQGQSVQWLSEQIGTSLQNCYKILHATSVNTEALQLMSEALNRNFFADYAALMEVPQLELPVENYIPDFHRQFYAIVEPVLLDAGYRGHIKDGLMTVWIGDPRIEVHHEEGDLYSEDVSLLYTLKDKRFKELHWAGCAVLANELALHNPQWSISFDYDKMVLFARYNCCVFRPDDLVRHLNDSNRLYCDLYDDLQWYLPQVLKDLPKDCPED